MTFFTPTEGFTHRGRFYGFPCYFAGIEDEGPMIAGTNVVWDRCILNVAPHIHRVIEWIRWAVDPIGYEPGDWQMEVLGEIEG